MEDKEALNMMRRCLSDIEQLRAERDRLAPLAEAYAVLRDVVRMVPKPSQGYGEDIAWVLKDRIQKIEDANKDADHG